MKKLSQEVGKSLFWEQLQRLWNFRKSYPRFIYQCPRFEVADFSSFSSLFFNCYNVVTNLVASRATHAEMLSFAAAHNIKPVIEEFELSEAGVADAISKLKSGKLRYRAVLHA